MRQFYILLFTLLFTHITISSFAQGEGNNWIFGNKAGLNFETDPPTILSSNDLKMNTLEGCASISNQAGELLFYTDGQIVWNKNYDEMPSSVDGLGNGLLQGASSSTQSSVVVPNPGDPNLYYIFTTDTRNNLI